MYLKLTATIATLLISSGAVQAQNSDLTNGSYVGLTFGYGDGDTQDINNPQASKKSINGGVAGLQVGHNWALGGGGFWGVEGDLQLGSIKNRWEGRSSNQFNSYYTEDKVKQSLALKAKVGYAQNSWAIYGSVGGILARTENSLGCDRALVAATNGCATKFNASQSSTTSGYTLGVGSEYKVSDGMSLKIEYNYVDLGKNRAALADPNFPAAPVNNRNFKTNYGVLNFGVNYRF